MKIKKKKLYRVVAVVVIGLVSTAFAARQVSAAPRTDSSPHQIRNNDKVIKFWTNSRVAKAVPRAFNRNHRSGRFSPASRWSNDWINMGSPWALGGDIQGNTGRVFFEMGGSYWTCSASAISDTASDRSIVLTAAHCAYDESGRYGFARQWMFVPDYSALPSKYDPNGLFCTGTSRGCWTANSLVVSSAYATAGGFNSEAVVHDYAFAVTGLGGKTNVQLDSVVDPNPVSWSGMDGMEDTFLFGYPAAGRYKGSTLIYCRGPLEYDGKLFYATYKVGCSMTGGSSGGPWLSPFENSGTQTGSGVVISLNSYGYGGTKAMYGPILGLEASTMFESSLTVSENTLVTP